MLVGCDVVALYGAVHLATGHITNAALVYMGATLGLLTVTGAFRHRLSLRLVSDIPSLLACLALPMVPMMPFLEHHGTHFDIMAVIPFATVLILVGRAAAFAMIRAARVRRHLGEATLIVGSGPIASDLAQVLLAHPEYGLVPLGFLDGYHQSGLPLPVLGDVDGLDKVLYERDIQTVIVAFGSTRDHQMVKMLRACDKVRADLYVVPRFFELGAATPNRQVDSLWGIPVARLRRYALRSRTWRLKRMFDVAAVSFSLLVAIPLIGLIALAVKATSPGPIFFRQKRVGQDGRLVTVLKFRTLHVNSDSDTTWSVNNDHRQTSVGRFLRNSSLDELPQLFNVLRGDMSLVGPRPERPHFVDQFDGQIRNYHDRHRVPVGMTGWAQIHGLRGDTSLEERARFDNDYIEQWSFGGDLIILLRTFVAVLRDLLAASQRIPSRPAAQQSAAGPQLGTPR